MPTEYDAVQFSDWGVWHALNPERRSRTLCGFNASKATSLRVRWTSGRMDPGNCERCTRSIDARTRKAGTQ